MLPVRAENKRDGASELFEYDIVLLVEQAARVNVGIIEHAVTAGKEIWADKGIRRLANGEFQIYPHGVSCTVSLGTGVFIKFKDLSIDIQTYQAVLREILQKQGEITSLKRMFGAITDQEALT